MIAGRSGSAFTAEIGAMKSHEEIDAMRALGLDPVEILVTPRVLALLISVPLLTFVGDLMGILGGGLAVWSTMDIAPTQFVNRLLLTANMHNFWVGADQGAVLRLPHRDHRLLPGLQGDGQRRVRRLANDSLRRQSIFVVIIVDALFALFFQRIHY